MAHGRGSFTGRLLLVANLAAANVAAAVSVVAFVQPGAVGLTAAPFAGVERMLVLPLQTGWAWLAFVAALALLLANFAWLVRGSRPAAVEPFVLSETPAGVVRIAREALEAALQKAGEALPEVTRLRVQVAPQGKHRIVVRGQFQCAEGTASLATSQRLRQAMHDRCLELVRLHEGGRVEFELEFQGFAGKLGKGHERAAPAEEPAPFTGPKYPIDDDTHLGGGS